MKNFLKKNKKVVITSVILSLILVAGLVAVKGKQIFSSRADSSELMLIQKTTPTVVVSCSKTGQPIGKVAWKKSKLEQSGYWVDIKEQQASWNDSFYVKNIDLGGQFTTFPDGFMIRDGADPLILKKNVTYSIRVWYTDLMVYSPERAFKTPDCK